jgi:hypothetical protein
MDTSQGDGEIPPTQPSDDVAFSVSSLEKGSEEAAPPLNGNDGNGGLEKAPNAVNPAPPAMHPEEGLRGWAVVAGGFCALFVSFGWINCAPPSSLPEI